MMSSELAMVVEKLSDARQRLCLVTLIAEIMGDVIQQSRMQLTDMLHNGDETTAQEFVDLVESGLLNIRTVAACLPATTAEDFDADSFFQGVTAKYGNTRKDLN